MNWEPINLANIGPRDPIRPTLGGVGLVYPTKRHVLSGPQESAKTIAAYAIGSERKTGGADVHLGFDTTTQLTRGGLGRFEITTHKDRLGHLKRDHVADLEVTSDPPPTRWLARSSSSRRSSDQRS